jgi:translation initiation factor IF-1
MLFRHRRGAVIGAGGTPDIDERLTLAKEELFTLEGLIDEILPDGRFGVMLDNEHRLICYTAGKMRKFRIRSVVGDRVHVEMTPYDLSKGRIVFRERTPGVGPAARRSGFRR